MDQDEPRELSEDEKEAVSAWLNHPMTDFVAGGFRAEAAKAQLELLGAARTSTDPKVVKWVTRFDSLTAAAKTIKEGAET